MTFDPQTVEPSPEIKARLDPALDAFMSGLGEYAADIMATVPGIPMGLRTMLTLQIGLGLSAMVRRSAKSLPMGENEGLAHYQGTIGGIVGGVAMFAVSMEPELKRQFFTDLIENLNTLSETLPRRPT